MKGVRSENNCYLWEPKNSKLLTTCPMDKERNEEMDQERTIKLEIPGPRTKIQTKEVDESDDETYIEELTNEELAVGYSEVCLLNGELSKRLIVYKNSYALL